MAQPEKGCQKDPLSTNTGISVEALASDIEQLKSDIQALKKENQGFAGWIKKWGPFVGLLAGVFAIAKISYDFYTATITRPQSSPIRGMPINFAYNPKAAKIKLTFNFSVRNTGTADDTIGELWATLTPAGYPTLVSFDSSKFHIIERGQDIPLPFTIAKGTTRDFQCVVESSLDAQAIPNVSGDWIVDVTITGQRRNAVMNMKYQLPIISDDIDEMKKSAVALNFLNPH